MGCVGASPGGGASGRLARLASTMRPAAPAPSPCSTAACGTGRSRGASGAPSRPSASPRRRGRAPTAWRRSRAGLGLGEVALVVAQHLAGERHVVARAARDGVVQQDGLAEAGRLGDAHVARDHGVEHAVAEVAPHLGGDLLGEPQPAVVHGEQHALDLQVRVEVLPHDLDRVEQLPQAFEREVLGLDRDQHGVRRRERVERQEAQARRAVDDDEVVGAARARERLLQHALALVEVDHLDLRADQVDVARHHVQKRHLGLERGLLDGHLPGEHLVDAAGDGPLVDAERRRAVRLRVGVDQQRGVLVGRERRGEVDRRRRLADAALLVRDRDDLAHVPHRACVRRSPGAWRTPRRACRRPRYGTARRAPGGFTAAPATDSNPAGPPPAVPDSAFHAWRDAPRAHRRRALTPTATRAATSRTASPPRSCSIVRRRHRAPTASCADGIVRRRHRAPTASCADGIVRRRHRAPTASCADGIVRRRHRAPTASRADGIASLSFNAVIPAPEPGSPTGWHRPSSVAPPRWAVGDPGSSPG